ncbi:MAG: hypothetical protein PHP83_00600 [Clostridia bacterium]|nr:hypothetical protein [Clostridia bacterium]
MDDRIFSKLNLSSCNVSPDGDMEVQLIDSSVLFRKLFFLEGKIGLYNLSKMLEEDNLKALENQVEQDIANGIISSNKDELNLET